MSLTLPGQILVLGSLMLAGRRCIPAIPYLKSNQRALYLAPGLIFTLITVQVEALAIYTRSQTTRNDQSQDT